MMLLVPLVPKYVITAVPLTEKNAMSSIPSPFFCPTSYNSSPAMAVAVVDSVNMPAVTTTAATSSMIISILFVITQPRVTVAGIIRSQSPNALIRN